MGPKAGWVGCRWLWPKVAIAIAITAGGAALSGCSGLRTGEPDQPGTAHPRLWSLAEISAGLAANAPLAVDPSFPTGILPQSVLTAQDDGTATLNVMAAFAEEQPAAYVVTDVWRGYDTIWAQPWYFLVTAWNELAPGQNRLKDASGAAVPGLFDVAPTSAFYSPFWLVEYAEVPPDADPARYHSTKTLFDDQSVLHPTSAFTYAIHPAAVTLPRPKPTHPYLGTVITGFSEAAGAYFEGTLDPYFNLGGNNFVFDQQLAIEENPLFIFATRGPDGAPQSIDVPAVAGVAPLLSGRAALRGASGPRLKAYYRLTWASLPATAAAFFPDAYPDAAALLTAASLNAGLYTGRVALNAFRAATATAPRQADCFASTSFPAGCQWIDSQARVEALLGPQALTPTAVTVAAPTVAVSAPAGPSN
jgi:hypothetical protein